MFDIHGFYEACVLVNGRAVTEVNHNGSTYIEGRNGSDYELHFSNRFSTRIMVVPSVDGLNVIDGNLCGTESPGYLVEPFGSIVIPGWKVDGNTAAKFQFRPTGGPHRYSTYTEAMGQSQENQGVIGFLVFKEKSVSTNFYTSWTSNNYPDPFFVPSGPTYGAPDGYSSAGGSSVRSASVNSTCDSYNVSYSASEVGTGFGDATNFNTHTVEFEKESAFPNATLVMYYDNLKGLTKRGVPVDRFKRTFTEEPNPFPASPTVYSGCTPPQGWKK